MRVRLNKNSNHLAPKWKKHGASSSNPTRTKHRDAAKLQLIAALAKSKPESIEIPSAAPANREIDRVSRFSKTTLGTTATNASLVQVNARVIQVGRDILHSRNPVIRLVSRHYSIDYQRRMISSKWASG